jgi:4-diphosphocytidyl-2-C-methyl-D-erythritol kinase
MSTSVAYNALGRTAEPVSFDFTQPDVIDSLDDLEGLFHNDFEHVVFERYPEVRGVKEKLLDLGACAAHLSGSGSAVFGLYEIKEDAEKARKDLDHDEGVFVKLVNNF